MDKPGNYRAQSSPPADNQPSTKASKEIYLCVDRFCLSSTLVQCCLGPLVMKYS